MTGQYYLVLPTLNAGLNIWSNADNIKKYPGNFGIFWAIGAGTGYLSEIGAGSLASGFQSGLNDLVRGDTNIMLKDMLSRTIFSTAGLVAMGSTLRSLGLNKVASQIVVNMTGLYVKFLHKVKDNSFDWRLTTDKIIGMTVSGVMAGLKTNSKFGVPDNMRIPGNFLTNFEIPSIVNPMASSLLLPYVPSIPLPTYFPGMSPSPLPSLQITPIPQR